MKNRHIFFLACLCICVAACNPRSEVPFDQFVSKFNELSVPMAWERGKVPHDLEQLDDAAAHQYLNTSGRVFPVGKVTKENYIVLICHLTKQDGESTVAFFLDNSGAKTNELVLAGRTAEVPDRIATSLGFSWDANEIRRTIEHKDSDASSDVSYNRVTTTIDDNGTFKHDPPVIERGDKHLLSDKVIPITTVTYLSEDMKGVELTGIFPRDHSPVFIIKDNQQYRTLTLSPDKHVTGDTKVDSVQGVESADGENGLFYTSMAITDKQNKRALFRQVMIKRVPIDVGKTYRTEEKDSKHYRQIEFQKMESITELGFYSDIHLGELDTNSCRQSGTLSVANHIAYYRGVMGCELVVIFQDKKLQVFQISARSSCGCGSEVSHDGEYMLKQ